MTIDYNDKFQEKAARIYDGRLAESCLSGSRHVILQDQISNLIICNLIRLSAQMFKKKKIS